MVSVKKFPSDIRGWCLRTETWTCGFEQKIKLHWNTAMSIKVIILMTTIHQYLSMSVKLQKSKDWAESIFTDCYSKRRRNQYIFIKKIRGFISEPTLRLKRPLVSKVINTTTGHSPFRSHLHKLKLTDELSSTNSGTDSDCNSHFIFKCLFQPKIRKQNQKPYQFNSIFRLLFNMYITVLQKPLLLIQHRCLFQLCEIICTRIKGIYQY